MAEGLRAQIDSYLPQLEALIQRGRQLRDTLAADPSSRSALEATRAWQQGCAAAVSKLSGGSKAHWLARSYSGAFLLRPADGRIEEEVPPARILDRVVEVLERAVSSLSRMDDGQLASASSEAPDRLNRAV